jgi:translation initiation factor IF-3
MVNNQFYRGRTNNRFKPKEQRNFTRVNYQIKAQTVRVVQEDGTQLGVYPIDSARKLAFDAGLDLVEIVANINPPVCRLTNFDKFRYEQKQKEKENKKKQKTVETKEIRLRPCTQIHDIETKVGAMEKFLGDGKKVVVSLEYKKRELSHREEGFKIINTVIEQTKEFAVVEMAPRMEGTRLVCRFAPKPKEDVMCQKNAR